MLAYFSPEREYGELDRYLEGFQRIFLVCGSSLSRLAVGRHLQALEERGNLELVRFSGFSPNPQWADIEKGIVCFQAAGCGLIAAAGGGSAIDTAKCIRHSAPLLETLGIPYFVIDKATTEDQVKAKLDEYRTLFIQGRQAAFVVRKGALDYRGKLVYGNFHTMTREDAIRHILAASGDDPVVSTTGNASRDVYEYRAAQNQGHSHDFLTVGSMGHSSSIALGIALQKKDSRVWCLDGDGAALMHLGAIAVIGTSGSANLIHIVLNNEAHESVGGLPTAAGGVDLCAIARACGYPCALSADCPEGLDRTLAQAKATHQLTFLEVKCALGARDDLGRPTTTPQENKAAFMSALGYGL